MLKVNDTEANLAKDTEVGEFAEGDFSCDVSSNWMGFGVSGGYLAAIVLRAAGQVSSLAAPISLGCHFLRPGRVGPATVEARVLHSSKISESIAVRLLQRDKVVLVGQVRTAGQRDGLEHVFHEKIIAPPWTILRSTDELEPDEDDIPSLFRNIELRPVTYPVKWPPAEPLEPRHRGWVKFKATPPHDDLFCDYGRELILLDTFGWFCLEGAHYGSPHLSVLGADLSVAFFGQRPLTEWLLVDHIAPVARWGVVASQGSVYSEDGTLLASCQTNLLSVGERG